jgi:hypothetical protein
MTVTLLTEWIDVRFQFIRMKLNSMSQVYDREMSTVDTSSGRSTPYYS